MSNLPRLVVFDLDFTLWDAGGLWCDCLTPPFRKSGEQVVDYRLKVVRLYDDVHAILDRLDEAGIDMALASRTERPVWAERLLDLLEIDRRFAWREIYPSSKLRHFRSLSQNSGYDFSEMLFFDDEFRNIEEVGALGVESVHVGSGMSEALLEEGLRRFK